MPEYPHITVYIEALNRHPLGLTLKNATVNSLFLIRTFQPHLRIAARLHWNSRRQALA